MADFYKFVRFLMDTDFWVFCFTGEGTPYSNPEHSRCFCVLLFLSTLLEELPVIEGDSGFLFWCHCFILSNGTKLVVKEFLKLLLFVVFVILVGLMKGFLGLSYWPFWLGAAIGFIIPDVDHLIYVYFLRPYEMTSQQVRLAFLRRDVYGGFLSLRGITRESGEAVFHTDLFQIVFLVFSFWVLSSSGSMLGRGIVVAFGAHLVLEEAFSKRRSLWVWSGKLAVLLALAFAF